MTEFATVFRGKKQGTGRDGLNELMAEVENKRVNSTALLVWSAEFNPMP